MTLKKLRHEIDIIDGQIFNLIAKRLKLSEMIGFLKKNSGKKIKNKSREKEILNHIENLTNKSGLNIKIAVRIWKILFNESRKIQKND